MRAVFVAVVQVSRCPSLHSFVSPLSFLRRGLDTPADLSSQGADAEQGVFYGLDTSTCRSLHTPPGSDEAP